MHSFDKQKLTFLPVRAQLREMEITEESVREAINFAIERANKRKEQDTAGAVDPVGPNQKPRMLQLSAFICHAGPPNLNGQAFTEDDLAKVVGNGLFQPPFFGMIDFNHDFNSYGAWYSAKYAFDPKAQQMGILAEGAIFAWRYTELADTLLAMQQRQGYIDVSMACMPTSYEEAKTDAGATYFILRDPVFFTTSVLDVDPADPTARALGSEDPAESSDSRAAELLRASIEATNTEEANMAKTDETVTDTAAESVVTEVADSSNENSTETETENKETTVLVHVEVVTTSDETETEVENETEVEATAATTPVNLENTESTSEFPAAPENTAERMASIVAELEAMKVAKQTAEAALAALTAQVEAMTVELAEFRAAKELREQEDRELAEAQKKLARMAQIPASICEALNNDEGQALIGKWMEQSDEMWEATTKVFSVAGLSTRETHADRSEKEGLLLATTDSKEGGFAITRWRRSK